MDLQLYGEEELCSMRRETKQKLVAPRDERPNKKVWLEL